MRVAHDYVREMFEVGVRECGEGRLNLWWCSMYILDSTELAFTFLFVLSLTGTKINDEIMGAALASCLAKAEKLAVLK